MMNTSEKIKMVLVGVLAAIATLSALAQEMMVVIKNVKDGSGFVRLALYNSDDLFMKTEIQRAEVKAENGEVVVVFKRVEPGIYAISVMHDSNDNKELDSNMFGIPREGFGFSNDAMGMFGPPDFKKASFEYTGNKITINLRYM